MCIESPRKEPHTSTEFRDRRETIQSKNFPTYPWNIPQTRNQQFMKEFLSFGGERGGLGYAPEVCWGSLGSKLFTPLKITPSKFNSEFTSEKFPGPNRQGSSSNHQFSGAILNFVGVTFWSYKLPTLFNPENHRTNHPPTHDFGFKSR